MDPLLREILSPSGQKLDAAKQTARAKMDCARLHLAQSQVTQAEACVGLAALDLFVAYAAPCWEFLNPDAVRFAGLVEAIVQEVGRDLACPELDSVLQAQLAEMGDRWQQRTAKEGDQIRQQLGYASQAAKVRQTFYRDWAREPAQRSDHLETLVKRIVRIVLGHGERQNGLAGYAALQQGLSAAAPFIAYELSFLPEPDRQTAHAFAQAEMERIQAEAASAASGAKPPESACIEASLSEDGSAQPIRPPESGAGQLPPGPPVAKPRGRPTKITDECKIAALKVKGNKERAKALYNVKHPSPQQMKNVSNILKHFLKTHPERASEATQETRAEISST